MRQYETMRPRAARAAGILTLVTGGFALGPAGAAAQQPQPEQPRTLTVSATAMVERAPDQALLLLAVESEASNARDAGQANASKMDKVVAALRAQGLGPTQVRTVSYTLQPQYAQDKPQSEPRIASYRAMNEVQVTIDNIDKVGGIIDAALSAGANRVANLSFGLKDSESARLEALQQAVAKAKREAEVMASAAGQTLGLPQSINTDGYMPPPAPPMPMYRRDAMAAAAPTPVEAGTLQISATVSIVYRLQ